MNIIRIMPGIPDDDNRDYLPERCKDSKIVVNENGNNSQPYPELLKEYRGILADGLEDVWYEYVPSSYEGNRKVPLVFSMHGGLMTGWGQAIYTSWTLVAERDGFIVVFPNAHSGRAWELQWGTWEVCPEETESGDISSKPEGLVTAPDDVSEIHDVKLTLALIELMKKKYCIDEGRIFMQGMSMGNMMTSLFARNYGNLLAGVAGSGCSTFLSLLYDENYRVKNKGGALAVWQTRPENNDIPEDEKLQKHVNKYNRLYWMRINQCDPVPEIRIQGEHNFAFYHGKKADLVYMDVKNRDHGQSFDDAALVWDYLFSGIRRNQNGIIERTESVGRRKGDKFSIAAAEGAQNIWFSGRIQNMEVPALSWKKLKYHGLEGKQVVRGRYLMLPLSVLSEIFSISLKYDTDRLSASMIISYQTEFARDARSCMEGRLSYIHGENDVGGTKVVQFARGSIGCIVNNCVHQMYCEALERNNELYISMEWFCREFFNLHVSSCDGVVYVTDHFSELSLYMADLIRDLLIGNAVP